MGSFTVNVRAEVFRVDFSLEGGGLFVGGEGEKVLVFEMSTDVNCEN